MVPAMSKMQLEDLQTEHDDHGLLVPDGGDGSDALHTTLEVLALDIRVIFLVVGVDLRNTVVKGVGFLNIGACLLAARLLLDGRHG